MIDITQQEIDEEIARKKQEVIDRKQKDHYEDLFRNPERHVMDKLEYSFIEANNLCIACVMHSITSYMPDFATMTLKRNKTSKL